MSRWEGSNTHTSASRNSLWRRAAADLGDIRDSDKFLTDALISIRDSRQQGCTDKHEENDEAAENEEGKGEEEVGQTQHEIRDGETAGSEREKGGRGEGSNSDSHLEGGDRDKDSDDQEQVFQHLLQLIVDDDVTPSQGSIGKQQQEVEKAEGGRGQHEVLDEEEDEEDDEQDSGCGGIEEAVALIRTKLLTLSQQARSSIQEEVIQAVSEQIDSYDRARNQITARTEEAIEGLKRKMAKEIRREDRRHAARLKESVCSCLQLFD